MNYSIAHRQIFISAVTAEFGSYRDTLNKQLTGPNQSVKVQEDFIAAGTPTLEKLDTYIKQCDVVIHLVGDMSGAFAQRPSVDAILNSYPDFLNRFPFLEPNVQALSYTQWEAWLALYHGNKLLIATPNFDAKRDEKYSYSEDQSKLQESHLALLEKYERYPEVQFSNNDQLATKVLSSILALVESASVENGQPFSDDWFKKQVNDNLLNLGVRYTPELNFELDIAKYFDALCRNDKFFDAFENEIHTLFKAFKRLDNDFLNQDIATKFSALLNQQVGLRRKPDLPNFDIEAIRKSCKAFEYSLSEYQAQLRNDEHGLSKESIDSKNFYFNQAYSALYAFREFINTPTLALANLPVLIVAGEAGIGKSHLLADVAANKLKENKACLLLLGQHFTTDEPPWIQILKNLHLINSDKDKLLSDLNTRAKTKGERLLFIVDAINEGKGRSFWPDHICAFINELSRYPWLGLVLSVRTSYEPLLTPITLIPENAAIRIQHHGFEGVEYQASSFFFAQHGIEQPSIPLLHPEFSNPLFLKLFCEGLMRSGQKCIPKGYGGITSIIDFFLRSIDEKLSAPSLFDYQPASSKKLVKKVVSALIKHKLENNVSYVSYDDAIDVTSGIVTRYSNKKDFVDHLISEGVLTKNIFGRNHDEEIVYFAYERFEDHLTADYLLTKCLDVANPKNMFQQHGALFPYLQNAYRYQGILEALSIQLPEKIDCELYELISEDKKSNRPVVEAFIKSLIWRKPETIKEKTKDYINQAVLVNDHTFDLFFKMVYSVASDPAHFYNADRLHRFLMKFSLAERDGVWTTYLHDQDEQQSPMQRLIDWARQDGANEYVSDDSRLLACKALSWLFTSTNIRFRDAATRALVCLLENHLPIATRLLTNFENVNDPYVYERILAAAYGGVLRSENLHGLGELSKCVMATFFQIQEHDEIYPNVLVRDYARNIIEYALYKQVITLENVDVIRPPYKSKFPDSFPSNDEIDAYKYDYKLNDSKYYWGQNAILRSMVTEYGRGMCNYGDFGRYTFQSKLHKWSYKFDPNDLSNYACHLIFEKFGYDIKKHGNFDKYAISGDRHSSKKERIGKKYQWLALYEVLARVSDNYPTEDASSGWNEDKKYIWYQGAWEPSIRNIDPTFIKGAKPPLLTENTWLTKVAYNDWSGSHKEWLISKDNLPNPKQIIELVDNQRQEWLVLEMFPEWEEPVPIGYEQHEYSHKHLQYQIQSYFVRDGYLVEFIDWLSKQELRELRLPENSDQYQIFSREYYWSPAYRFFDNPYYGRSLWEDIYEDNDSGAVLGEVMVTTERHNWESAINREEQSSYLAPRELMYNKMQLKYSNNIGKWLNSDGEVVCFDPSVNSGGDNSLLVRKDVLLRFLAENNLKMFWTCLGEKQIRGDSCHETKYSKWIDISSILILTSNGIDENTSIKSMEI